MNRRRKIYKGFNKRHRVGVNRLIVVAICTCIIAGYTFTKIKNTKVVEFLSDKVSAATSMNLIDKLPIINKFKEKDDSKSISYEDVSKELDEIDKDKEKDKKEDVDQSKNEEESQDSKDVKVGVVDGWSLYTIQVASVTDMGKMESVKEKLDTNQIPFSMLEKDGSKKVQTYSYFDEKATRSCLDQTKKVFPDAFITEIEVPTISLEYTQKYKYIGEITKDLNSLVGNFKEESQFWTSNNLDMSKYNMILTKRKGIIQKIDQSASQIDYKGLEKFKNNLVNYSKEVDQKIQMSSQSANEGKYNESKSLYLSCMQGYYMLINSIKEV